MCAQRPPLPNSPADLTPKWLTAALGEGGVLPRGAVTHASWERVGEGYGFTGLIGRVRLGYDSADGDPPSSLVAKLPLARAETVSGYRARQERDPALVRRHYDRAAQEVVFYREVGPSFAPALYYGAADEARRRVVLLLEDLTGARQGDVLRGCSVEEAALLLERLAPFHARHWGDAAPAHVFPRSGGDPRVRQERYGRYADVFLDRYGERLPTAVREIVEQLRSELARVIGELDVGATTLIHGDLHLDNVLFDAPGGRPVVVLDWQTAAVGAPSWDLALFLYGSLSPGARRASEDSLLGRYIARLGVPGYTLDDARRDSRLALLTLLAGTVVGIASLEPGDLSARERRLHEAAVEDGRLVTALLDHGAIALAG